MKEKFVSITVVSLIATVALIAQPAKKDAILMTVGDDKVTVEEFLNIFKKNNNRDATLDKKSMEEYLELYTIFRLKIKEAKELGLDTSKAFREELAGYRKTLVQPHLNDSNAIKELVKEAYNRMQWDIRSSHILAKLDANPSPEDTLEAYTRIMIIKDFLKGKPNIVMLKKYETMVKTNVMAASKSKVMSKADSNAVKLKLDPMKKLFEQKSKEFSSVAKIVSEHNSKNKGGDVGYLSAMTQGFPYEYESAAFNSKPGEISGPFRSPMGYHLIMVTDKRPHKELRVSHILLNFKKGMTHDDSLKLKVKIDSLYKVINSGASFEEIAQKISDHKETGKKGGDLGWIVYNGNFPSEFKDAAFAIRADGQISEPVQTRFGWHIIKRTGIRDLAPFDSIKTELKAKVQKDARAAVAKERMIAKLKEDYKFTEILPRNISDFYAVVDSTLPMGQWKAEKASGLTKPMFRILDKTYTQQDFAKYLEKNYRMVGRIPPKRIVDAMYKPFVDESLMNMKESRLEIENHDFRVLMQEYHDGILLFNHTDQKVWSKAIKDTIGAKEFYEKNKEKFMWEERLDASIYTVKDAKIAEKVRKMIKQTKTDKEILSALNKDTVINVTIDSKLYLKGDNAMLDKTGWVPGITPNETVKDKIVFANIRKVVKPTPKTYAEARGMVTSEYQAWLEKEWINSLRAKYPVIVDRKVFDSIQ